MKLTVNILLLTALAILVPTPAFACAACYGGNIDSPMADGMNWGIFALLGVILPVLACFLTFLIYLIRKSEALAAAAENHAESPNKV